MKDEINETNIEKTIQKAIKRYLDKSMLIDGLFWKHAIVTLAKKYKFVDEYNKCLKGDKP